MGIKHRPGELLPTGVEAGEILDPCQVEVVSVQRHDAYPAALAATIAAAALTLGDRATRGRAA